MDKTLEQRVYDLEDRTRSIHYDLTRIISDVDELAKSDGKAINTLAVAVEDLAKSDYKALKALAEVVEDIQKKHNGLAKIIEALACKFFTDDDERVAELIEEAGDME